LTPFPSLSILIFSFPFFKLILKFWLFLLYFTFQVYLFVFFWIVCTEKNRVGL
jgi:hypothetical protein